MPTGPQSRIQTATPFRERPAPRFNSSLVLAAAAAALALSSCATRIPSVPVAAVAPASRTIHVEDGLANHLESARESLTLLRRSPDPDEQKKALDDYNAAVEAVLLGLQEQAPPSAWDKPLTLHHSEGTFRLRFDDETPDDGYLPATVFRNIVPAHMVKRLSLARDTSRPGFGVPVILVNQDTSELVFDDQFVPKNGVYLPATAVLEFPAATAADEGATPVHLRLCHVLEEPDRFSRRYGAPIALDYSAGVSLGLSTKYLRRMDFVGLFWPDRHLDDIGLFYLTPYDPDKTQVVFVHGLDSSPFTWRNAVNELLADDYLRENYSVAYFVYPTGLGIPASASRLRKSLKAARDYYDPDHNDHAFNNTILVGHSMGGILSRMQVIDSGNHFWKAFFRKPPEAVDEFSARNREEIRQALFFENQPYITRVVFICTPHRGSKVADMGIVRAAVKLIELPVDTGDALAKLATAPLDILNPSLLQYKNMGMTSVENLSPEHPFFQALNAPEIEAPYHSIIATLGGSTGEDAWDGVVPYTSSHVEGAESETFVPYWHACSDEPETVEEVLRILRLHAAESR